MEKLKGKGGRGRNQGHRPGTYKNAEKTPEQRYSVKQQVTYTPEQFERVAAAMVKTNVKKHTDFARYAVLKFTDEILTNEDSCRKNK